MSSAYIPEIEKPKGCMSCLFSYFTPQCDLYCPLLKQCVEPSYDCIDIDCKVKFLPNHGRLIEAESLKEVIHQHDYPLAARTNSIDFGMFTIGIDQAIDEAETIIDKEEKTS